MAEDSSSRMTTVKEIHVIPWDPESPEHIQRLIEQRIACGWNAELVESKWIEQQRLGHKSILWLVLSDETPSWMSLEEQHVAAYPSESTHLSDSAITLGGKPRLMHRIQPFITLGHVSLDSEEADLPHIPYDEKEAYRIANLYVSRALQSAGLGRAAMDALERMAVTEPFCAKTLVIGTAVDNTGGKVEEYKDIGKDSPARSIVQWYARRGYVTYKYIEAAWYREDNTPATAVFMKKDMK